MWNPLRVRPRRIPTDAEVPISFEEEWAQEPWASRPVYPTAQDQAPALQSLDVAG